jgi:hypothetical protein
MTRRTLPQRRASKTFDLRFWNQLFTVAVGFYVDGTPGEVFIDGCNELLPEPLARVQEREARQRSRIERLLRRPA